MKRLPSLISNVLLEIPSAGKLVLLMLLTLLLVNGISNTQKTSYGQQQCDEEEPDSDEEPTICDSCPCPPGTAADGTESAGTSGYPIHLKRGSVLELSLIHI